MWRQLRSARPIGRSTCSVDLHGALEYFRRKKDARSAKALEKLRTNSARLERSKDPSIRANAFPYETENTVHADDVFFETGDLRNIHDFSGAIAQARHLHDDRNRGGDLLAHRPFRHIDA